MLMLLILLVFEFPTVQGFLILQSSYYVNRREKNNATPTTNSHRLYAKSKNRQQNNSSKTKTNQNTTTTAKKKKKGSSPRPKLIIFDLDGCLWKPELFELISPNQRRLDQGSNSFNTETGNDGSFFAINCEEQPYPGTTLTTPTYQRLELLGATRSILHQLYYDEDWMSTMIGISSRTDCPDWAMEAMDKFVLYSTATEKDIDSLQQRPPINMKDVFLPQLCVLDRNQNKVDQFESIQELSGQFCGGTNTRFKEMMFFDNEAGNCRQVATLGVTTIYCPQGLTQSAWEDGIQNFPTSTGKVLGSKMPY